MYNLNTTFNPFVCGLSLAVFRKICVCRYLSTALVKLRLSLDLFREFRGIEAKGFLIQIFDREWFFDQPIKKYLTVPCKKNLLFYVKIILTMRRRKDRYKDRQFLSVIKIPKNLPYLRCPDKNIKIKISPLIIINIIFLFII